MIPTEDQVKVFWEKYGLPEKKRRHVVLVAKVAGFLATKCQSSNVPGLAARAGKCQINFALLKAAALLHDIDKNVEKLPGEKHPDAGVRILRQEGMGEVADVVKTHSVHAILDPSIAPKSIEQKLLFLADKMVKQDVVGVDRRFKQWNEEDLRAEDVAMLGRCYPRVKDLEREIAGLIGMEPGEIFLHLQKMKTA